MATALQSPRPFGHIASSSSACEQSPSASLIKTLVNSHGDVKYCIGNTVRNIVNNKVSTRLLGGEHFGMCVNSLSPCCMPETNERVHGDSN